MEAKIKVFGRITNFEGKPLKGAIIRLLNDRLKTFIIHLRMKKEIMSCLFRRDCIIHFMRVRITT
jgi:hypothetical protein